MVPGKFTDDRLMAATKLDAILDNIRTIMGDVDIRQQKQWNPPTLEHAKARLQWIAACALEAMNLIDELAEQLSED